MPLSPTTLDVASHGTLQRADYTYDREADCFIVTDDRGSEICRTRSPHMAWHKDCVRELVERINLGILIFPTTGDTTQH